MAETERGNAASNEEESSVEMSNNNAIERGANLSEVVQTDGNRIKEKIAEIQGDATSHKETSCVEMSNNNSIKRGRGRPQGSMKLNKLKQVLSISTSESKPPRRGRGRPKLPKATELEGSGDDLAGNSVQTQEPNKQSSDEDGPTADRSPRKRGRPKKSLYKSTCDDAEDLPNGASDAPKAKRGRPKGSTKRKSGSLTGRENGGSSVQRQNPRRSSGKKPRLETEESSENGEDAERPKKIKQETAGSPPAKKRPGRPKGSLNKKRPAYKAKPWKRGRPRKPKAKRGRPRKYPLPSPEELKKPKVWKPLGRPRKYPRADPAEGSEPAPRRSRGRPHKTQSKKGAHLRKTLPESLSLPSDPGVEPQRKRGRPPSAPKSDAVPTRKRGRPKGSVNSSKAGRGAPIDSADDDHSTAESDSAPMVLKCEEEEAEIKEDASINQDADSEVSNQA
uniref:origin recognition complex subunit 4 n=1 Tax=Gasterosteus aculeatus aculeatus TaxID=481459 RepID=UPI001A99C11F|nr:origin recognition complex subunit 4 [Gasterosteus aculeatus aculeatus]XP_040045150.1 origin recognition complex subunit 4 [Gasterosteus aculeatus aculeatus]